MSASGLSLPDSLYRYIWMTSGKRQLVLVGLSAVVAPLAMVPLELQRRVVNDVLESEAVTNLIALCMVYLVATLLQGALKYLMNVYRGRTGELAIKHFRSRIFADSSQREADETSDGTTVSMIVAEVEPLGGFVGESISVPVVQAGTFLSVFCFMVWTEPYLSLVVLFVIVPQLFLVPYMQGLINKHTAARIEIVRKAGDQAMNDDDTSILRKENQKKYLDNIEDIFNVRIAIFKLKYRLKFSINFLNHLGTLGILFVGGWLAISGATEIGTIVAFVSGMHRVSDPWRELVTYFRQASDARVKYGMLVDAIETIELPLDKRERVGR